jgi:hypothetical protein
MLVYKNGIDVQKLQLATVAVEMEVVMKSAVATSEALPAGVDGDARMALDSDHLYVSLNGEWLDQGVLDVQDLLQERLMQELS